MNAGLSIAKLHQDHVANAVNANHIGGTASIEASAKLSTVRIPHAKQRKGTKASFGKKYHAAQDELVSACMPGVSNELPVVVDAAPAKAKHHHHNHNQKSKTTKQIMRTKVVTPATGLPQLLVSVDSPIYRAMSSLEWSIENAKRPKPAGIKAVEDIRAAAKSACKYYEPCDETLPFFADGKGILCASGTPGYAVFNGKACTHHCRLGDVSTGRGDTPSESWTNAYVSVQSLLASLEHMNKIETVLA
jgi:hypothetical protein